jgi:HNH endonuclease
MSDCILWSGPLGAHGYGRRTVNGKRELAHRVAWAEAYGSIPAGRIIHHDCANKLCVNVGHMRCITQAEHASIYDARSPFKTHCKRGHEIAVVGRTPLGGCRECGRQANRASYRKYLDDRRAGQRAHYWENRERIRARQRDYYARRKAGV